MAHQVLVCHPSRDKAVADAAGAALEVEGITCRIAPRDVPAVDEDWASDHGD